MQKKPIIATAVILVAAAVLYFFVLPSSSEPAAGAMQGGGPSSTLAVVTAASVEQGDFSISAEFVGTLQAISFAELYAKANGPVTRLFAETGDRVQAGQVLAQVDDAEALQGVRQAEAALKMAEATRAQRQAALQVAQTDAARTEGLYAKKLVAEQDYQAVQAALLSAEAQLRLSEAQIEQAKANVSQAQLQLDNTRVRAPFDGFIGKRLMDLGAMSSTSRPVFTLVDVSTIKTTVPLVDKDVTHIRPGQAVSIASDAFPGRIFDGKVARISPVFNPETGTTDAEIEVGNPGGVLRPGMLVRVSIAYQTEQAALLVPYASVVRSGEGAHLFIAEEQEEGAWSARQVPVRVLGTGNSRQGERMMAVEGTIQAGDQVVTIGQENLRDGATVQVGTSSRPVVPEAANEAIAQDQTRQAVS